MLLLSLALAAGTTYGAEKSRPNILWITSEDHGPHLGCYGDAYADTPQLDAFAARSLRYNFVWSNAPVCAPARTTLIMGLHATSTGAEQMRSMVAPPAGCPPYPSLLRTAGYYCTNNVKTDYNLALPKDTWNESSNRAHWRNRPAGSPFFAIFNSTRSHESKLHGDNLPPPRHDPARAPVPPYHPDTPGVRADWARYYDSVSAADADAGAVLAQLEADGLAADTIVFYFADHGSGLPRHKRWPGDSGLRVPLIVHIPEKFDHLRPPGYAAGATTDRLVSFVDFAPTLLSLAGIEPPGWMQGRAFLGEHPAAAPEFLHGYRGRMDERPDLVRSVTDGRFVYIRNYRPDLPAGQHLDTPMETPTTRAWCNFVRSGRATDVQSAFWQPHPPEELYDLSSDPHETVNLADSPAHTAIKSRLRAAQQAQARAIRDPGFLPEAELHTRRPGVSPHDFARDDKAYPFERVFATAELAAGLNPADSSRLIPLLDDPDSAVRHWAVRGLAIRGADSVRSATPRLRSMLADTAKPVAIVAAEALARHGAPEDRAAALDLIGRLADPARNDYFTSLAALTALDDLGLAAAQLHAAARAFPREHPAPPDSRYGNYPGRVLAHALRPPNIVVILADDLGWSDIGAYGSEIPTPNLDRLAAEGVRFTQFFNTSKCNPSRASLLTGLYAHQAGNGGRFGPLTDGVTLGEVLRPAGYRTLFVGKNHHNPENPFDRGFDRYFGMLGGATNHFNPGFQREGEPPPGEKRPQHARFADDAKIMHPFTPPKDYFSTDAYTDRAVAWLDEYRDEQKPVLLYVAYQAPHDPLQAWPEDIARHRGRYHEGYEAVARARYGRQRASGLLDTTFPRSTPTHVSWESLTAEERSLEEQRMEVYAAMIDNMDRNIGRILDRLRETGRLDNTLVLFLSDNGASGENAEPTVTNNSGPIGSIGYWASFDHNWANVSGTPFRYDKNSSYAGGTCTPLIAWWPGGIAGTGRVTHWRGHLIDIMPTLVELAGATYPKERHGHPIPPMEGISLVPVLRGDESPRATKLFWQWQDERAVADGRWRAVQREGSWSLFDTETDRTETKDLAKVHPDVLARLTADWADWAFRVGAETEDRRGRDARSPRKSQD